MRIAAFPKSLGSIRQQLLTAFLIFVFIIQVNCYASPREKRADFNKVKTSNGRGYNAHENQEIVDPDESYELQAVNINSINEGSLSDFEVTSLLLASDIEGNLHALNRESGEIVWSLLGDSPLVEISTSEDSRAKRKAQSLTTSASPAHSGSDFRSPSSQIPDDGNTGATPQHTIEEDNMNSRTSSAPVELTWMIEPYGGGTLYYFTQENGLEKLPTSVEQLIAKSPFSLSDDFVYTGTRRSGFLKIDARTGDVLQSFGNEYSSVFDYDLEDTPFEDEEEIPTILIGKTTYELLIHSKNNTSWNIKYSTYGPNNLHSALAYQNQESADNLYIQPTHDNSLLALDSESKSFRWASSLPSVTVNVFDVYYELNNHKHSNNNRFIILPHPFNNANEERQSTTDSTFIDKTEEGSWFALSELHYPSLVRTAPLAKYISHERWRKAPIYQDSKLLYVAITGVHDDSLRRDSNTMDFFDPLRLPAYAFPTNIAEEYDPKKNNRKNQLSVLGPNDPLRIDGVLPEHSQSNTNQMHPSKSQIDATSATVYNTGILGFLRPVLKFIYKAIESLLVTLASVVMLVVLTKLGSMPSVGKFLRKFGITNKPKDLIDILIVEDVKEPVSSDDKLESETIEIPKIVETPSDESSSTSKTEVTVEKSTLLEHSRTSSMDSNITISDSIDSTETADAYLTEGDNESISTIGISRVPTIDGHSTQDAQEGSNGIEELETEEKKKKRKRGKRGGKKNKNKEITDDSIELKNNEESLIDVSTGSATAKIGSPVLSSSIIDPAKFNNTNNLIISNNILGYGAHGTIVFQGSFESRPVAVKRMLIDFYDVASHEIKLLLESDFHPNVIRYFCSQESDRFLYIALELCTATLEDVIEKKKPEAAELFSKMDPADILWQIGNGLQHLHSLKIVHRDIKPQNILVVEPKKLAKRTVDDKVMETPVRLLISDFGLCKKLDTDQSSFKATGAQPSGTSGWRAPELLEDPEYSNKAEEDPSRRLTKSIDIFALGCVFFYVLTNGSHPFGKKYIREDNIMHQQCNLSLLSLLPDQYEARSLISSMIEADPDLRPDMPLVLQHPYFWKIEKKLDFLLRVSDRFEVERRDPPSALLLRLEEIAPNVVGAKGWFEKFDSDFMDNLGKYRKYNTFKIMDLLRAMRNKYHHYQDLPPSLAKKMTPLPDGFYRYFADKFPNILMEIYGVVCAELIDDEIFRPFF